MDIKEVSTFLETNKDADEVKNFVKAFYTPERLNPFLDSEDGLKVIQPRLDKHSTQAITTFKEKSLPGIIAEEVKKAVPGETEEQKRIRKIEQELQDSKNTALKATLTNKAISKLTELKLPVAYADLVIGSDEESTLKKIKIVQDNWESEISKRVDEKFKANGRKKPGEKDNLPSGNSMINDAIRKAAGVTVQA